MLLINWLETDPWPPWYAGMALMFQKEVAERIVAAPDSKAAKRPVEPPVKPADKAPVRSTATPPGTSGPGSRDSRIGF